MNYTRELGQKRFVKLAELEKGQDVCSGKFLGFVTGKFGMEGQMELEDGALMCLPKAGHLNYLLETFAKEGENYRIVYDGKETIDNGKYAGTMGHRFKLFGADKEPEKDDDFPVESLEEDEFGGL